MTDREKELLKRVKLLEQDVGDLRRDNLALRQKAKQAEEASRAKSDFLTMISHEIRTPMNGVLGISELLLNSGLNSRQAHFAELILSSARNLLFLIDSLLDFSKIEAEQMVLEIEPFNLLDLTDELMKLYKAAGEKKKLTVHAKVDQRIKKQYLGDSYRIRQILVNLLSNALKFTESGFVLLRVSCLEATRGGHRLRFAVEDSGPGIPKEKEDLLFLPFSQLDSSTTRRYGGTGLGLSICSKLVKLMNGEIGVHSGGGAGSVFWFELTLPESDQEQENFARAEGKISLPDMSEPRRLKLEIPQDDCTEPRILIVDDDQTNRMVLREVFRDSPSATVEAKDGHEAVGLYQSGKFDAIFMDCQMPRMDGFVATRVIRELSEQNGEYPVIIALTADATPATRQRCKDVGMDDYLLKPLDFEELERVVKAWMPEMAPRAKVPPAGKQPVELAESDEGGAAQEAINRAVVEHLKRNVGDIRPILTVFLKGLPARVDELAQAAARGDDEQTRLVAHTIKGSSSQFGAELLAALCFQLERMGSDYDQSAVLTLVQRIRAAAVEVVEYLSEELD